MGRALAPLWPWADPAPVQQVEAGRKMSLESRGLCSASRGSEKKPGEGAAQEISALCSLGVFTRDIPRLSGLAAQLHPGLVKGSSCGLTDQGYRGKN